MIRVRALAMVAAIGCGADATARDQAEAAAARAQQLATAQTEAGARASITELEAAFGLWFLAGEPRRAAEVAGEIGGAWDNLGDMTAARAWSAHALALYRAAGDRHGEAMALSWVGIAEVHLGAHAAAIAKFEQARAMSAGRDDEAHGYALLNLGFVYERVDEWTRSADFLVRALPAFVKRGDRASEATTHNNLGRYYYLTGDADRALRHHELALAIRRAEDRRLDLGWSLINIAGVQDELLGDPEAALGKYREALAIWTQLGNKIGMPLAEDGIGRALARIGRLAEARGAFERAIALYREIKSPRGVAESGLNRAEVLARLGQHAEARRAFEDGAAGSREIDRPSEQARALVGLARLDRAAGDLAAARARIGEAIALIETVRARVIRDEHRTSYFATVQTAYELAIELAIAAGDVEAALIASERARARTLLEAIARSGGRDRAAAARSASELRGALDGETVAVSYALGDARSFAFVVARDAVRAIELAPRAEIEGAARALVAQATARRDVDAEARALERLVIAPIAGELRAPRIAIAADGALHFAPLGVLPALRDRELALLPSLTTLVELRERPPRTPSLELAVIADPVYAPDDPRVAVRRAPAGPTLVRLQWSRLEADGIARGVAADRRVVLVDHAATTDAALGPDLARARVVHFATHAVIDPTHPERSAIVLGTVDREGHERDGELVLGELDRLQWAAELVVLSGCRTALGRAVRGEGLVGLVGGFLRAGAPRVVASLWQVDDRATAELMQTFHARLRDGRRPALALREAQRAIAAKPQWRSPYYWAGFSLYGDWR